MNIAKLLCAGRFGPEFHNQWRWCFHTGKTGQQKMAEQQDANDVAQQQKLTDASQGTLSQFEGPVQQSPYYKALLNTGTEATSKAYQAARANQTAKANMAGFGYTQPVAQGADAGLASSEATALGNLPSEAAAEAAPTALQAANQTGNMATNYGNQAQGWNNQAYQMQKQRGSIWSDLLNVGKIAAGGLLPFAKSGSGSPAPGSESWMLNYA